MNPNQLPSVGDTLAEKYQLTRLLGQGGMGAVFEAIHRRLGTKVAIKVVLPEVARRPELAYRFEQEARAAAKLQGRHAVRVLDVDTTPEGVPFMVMELLNGHSLRDELRQRGPLPIEDAVRYLREACEGVDEAHRAGIIHRDLKPANLFLSVEGEGWVVKVVDFGIAKTSDADAAGYRTATDAALGTYHYMSPEQARSPRSVDARTDVWSLGVVLYQLLSGRLPFQGDSAFGVMYALATQKVPSLGDARADAPEALVAIVERALCKDAEGRYQTVRELSDALAPFDTAYQQLSSRSPISGARAPSSRLPAPSAKSPPLSSPAVGATPPSPVSTRSPSSGAGSAEAFDIGSATTISWPVAGDGGPVESAPSGAKGDNVLSTGSRRPAKSNSSVPFRAVIGMVGVVIGGGIVVTVGVSHLRANAAVSAPAARSTGAPLASAPAPTLPERAMTRLVDESPEGENPRRPDQTPENRTLGSGGQGAGASKQAEPSTVVPSSPVTRTVAKARPDRPPPSKQPASSAAPSPQAPPGPERPPILK
jgi:eukaryotic-like serine/threonine-protein kinase